MFYAISEMGMTLQSSLPTAYCICSSDYIHKMRNKTTAYGSADSLKPAIWGPSIILVLHSPSLVEALAKPYHHCSHLNSITDAPARGDGDVIKIFIDIFILS